MQYLITSVIDAMISTEGLAILVGLVMSWGGTQAAKKHCGFGGPAAAALAFALGATPTYFIWPGWDGTPLFVAAAVGLCSPTAYKIAVFFVRKRWPKLADELSGDRRA